MRQMAQQFSSSELGNLNVEKEGHIERIFWKKEHPVTSQLWERGRRSIRIRGYRL